MAALTLIAAKAGTDSSSFPPLGCKKRRGLWFLWARTRPGSQMTFALHRQHDADTPALDLLHDDMLEVDLCRRRAEQLKEQVARTLDRNCATGDAIECIDEIQHLGIAHLFTERIGDLLDRTAECTVDEGEGLFQAALRFRVLRHNGYNVAPDLFRKFLTREGKFKESLTGDWRGLLSLHEACHYGTKHEEIMSRAMEFSRRTLKSPKFRFTPQQIALINNALELPRHMRMERYEAWRLIQESTHPNGNPPPLLELASLDYNMVQSQYKEELEEFTRWWRELSLANKLSFVRDRPQEFFLGTAAILPQPFLSRCRIELTKSVSMCYLLDDLYNNYGSLEELTLFTDAIKRWDLQAMEELPEVMKICYLALYNTTNKIGSKLRVYHGKCVTPHLRKTFVDMCEALLLEAKWFNRGIVPSLEEYLKNGIISAGTYVFSLQAFLFMTSPVSEESLRLFCSGDGPFSHSGRILRLWNDLGTAKAEQERGDVASSIQCYMQERGHADDGDARRHIRGLVSSAWRDLNEDAMAPSPLPFSVFNVSFNLARFSQFLYQHADDPTTTSVNLIVEALFFKPV